MVPRMRHTLHHQCLVCIEGKVVHGLDSLEYFPRDNLRGRHGDMEGPPLLAYQNFEQSGLRSMVISAAGISRISHT
ncbi:Os03g0326350 [Oryza sativa Japonica Group]|uniref:Os03g0326350 protein n=1 Tax=Oryza sativa subsp. japonica TaxID=39947 RepID=A0A0P0VX06_ORYSJ|nr:hypothetical protein EE612_017155 [Oryza sativa]BAS83996.1 Os03g0326350 [Oryza sativa Japonica Group]